MKKINTLTFFAVLLCSIFSFAQEKAYSPTIGIGIGSIGFYGDLNDRDYGSPIGGNPALSLYLIQPATDYLSVRFRYLNGSIREEERSLQRNVNFESNVQVGALMLEYNFDHFLRDDRKITPFISTGIEAVEFNPKTDLLGFGGEPYNYWSDGSIRNLPENSDQANIAVVVRRDYDYETDIREAGFNNSTDYLERAFSIPVGFGADMHLNDQMNFRLESTIHFTFTDLMDGITPTTSSAYVDQKRGNGRNDIFVVSGFSLSYNFQKVEPAEPFERFDDGPFDFLSTGNTEDFDQDGIIDLVDQCPNTPRGIEVDTTGCPVDTDGDGIPDYKDDEINSEYPEFANAQGVEMTDDMLYESYLQYIDSTLELAEVIERDFTGQNKKKRRDYRVQLQSYSKGGQPEDMSKLLSLKDLSKIDQGNQTIYAVGSYNSLNEANARANRMKAEGFSNASVIKKQSSNIYTPVKSNDKIETEPNTTKNQTSEKPSVAEELTPETSNEVVFRVQLGAFRNKPTEENFRSIPNLFVVESGGFYRYMSGAFSSFDEAARHKVKMVVEGFKGAFVVAYKGGKRVSLKSVGVKTISSDPIIGK